MCVCVYVTHTNTHTGITDGCIWRERFKELVMEAVLLG